MNKWECQHVDCDRYVIGCGGAIGLRAIGWYFQLGPTIYCPTHRSDVIDPLRVAQQYQYLIASVETKAEEQRGAQILMIPIDVTIQFVCAKCQLIETLKKPCSLRQSIDIQPPDGWGLVSIATGLTLMEQQEGRPVSLLCPTCTKAFA